MDVFPTEHGAVRGFRARADVVAVLGIPYAAPPFGDNRFREPLAASAWPFGLPDGLTAGYRAAMPHAPVLDVYLAVYADLIFGEYGNRLAELHARAGGRTSLSRFDRRRADARAAVRACHCADVPFAFGNLDDERLSFLVGGAPTPADRTPARRMVRAWADFAATGSPGRSPVRDSATEVRT